MPFFKAVRVVLLLMVLLFVAVGTWHSRVTSTDWNDPLWVVIYPVNGDGETTTQNYIDSLTRQHFQDIDAFMLEEAERYGVTALQPVETHLSAQIESLPPALPRDGGMLQTMWWSLKMRLWAWRVDNFDGATADIQVFAVYFDGATTPVVPDSLGMQQGLLAIANLFASEKMASSNNVVITHEMLHTLGATDKYDPADNYPIYPQGFADPEQTPLLPQQWAEIMAGRVPVTESQADIPLSLRATLIGDLTAAEIRFLTPE